MESRVNKVGIDEVRFPEVGPNEVCSAQVRLTEVRSAKVRPTKLRSEKDRPTEIHLHEVRLAKLDSAIHPLQTRNSQIPWQTPAAGSSGVSPKLARSKKLFPRASRSVLCLFGLTKNLQPGCSTHT